MPKPVALTPDLVETPQVTPQAATPARAAASVPAAKDTRLQPKNGDLVPLQVRLPRPEVRAIKVASAEREQTISDFMLACFHAYMKL